MLAGGTRPAFVPSTPNRLRAARTYYDHIAGTLGVSLHDRFQTLGWLSADSTNGENECELTACGTKAFEMLGIDLDGTRTLRRRFAYACVGWSELRPHFGWALGAALLNVALKGKGASGSRQQALGVTSVGRREIMSRFGLQV